MPGSSRLAAELHIRKNPCFASPFPISSPEGFSHCKVLLVWEAQNR